MELAAGFFVAGAIMWHGATTVLTENEHDVVLPSILGLAFHLLGVITVVLYL